MKIILFSLLCLFLIGISSSISAQYTEVDSHIKYTEVDSRIKLPQIFLQLELRDSNGNLVTYIEAEQIIVIYPLELNEFLDNQSYKEFLIKDGKAYEIIQWQGKTEKFDKRHVYSLFNLYAPEQNEFNLVLTANHNSYKTQPGDTLRVFWTIIRPAS